MYPQNLLANDWRSTEKASSESVCEREMSARSWSCAAALERCAASCACNCCTSAWCCPNAARSAATTATRAAAAQWGVGAQDAGLTRWVATLAASSGGGGVKVAATAVKAAAAVV